MTYSPFSNRSPMALPNASHCAFTSGVMACFISTGSPTASKCKRVSFHSCIFATALLAQQYEPYQPSRCF